MDEPPKLRIILRRRAVYGTGGKSHTCLRPMRRPAIIVGGERRDLSPFEENLIWLLLAHPVVRSDIIEDVLWPIGAMPTTKIISVHICYLRGKLRESGWTIALDGFFRYKLVPEQQRDTVAA